MVLDWLAPPRRRPEDELATCRRIARAVATLAVLILLSNARVASCPDCRGTGYYVGPVVGSGACVGCGGTGTLTVREAVAAWIDAG